MKKLKRIRAYLSHPIRGSSVELATKKCQFSNGERGADAALKIENAIPGLSIICPGRYEKFVYYIYSLKLLTDQQILDIDCRLLADCDVLLVYDFDKSRGVEIEISEARRLNKPIFRFKKLNAKTIDELRQFIEEVRSKK